MNVFDVNASAVMRFLLVATIAIVSCSCRDRAQSSRAALRPGDSKRTDSFVRTASRRSGDETRTMQERTSLRDELTHEASRANEMLNLPESQVRAWGNRLIGKTMGMCEPADQKAVATAFAAAIKAIRPFSLPHEKWAAALYNYRSMVESCGHLLGRVNSWDEAFSLLHGNVLLYRDAISRCEKWELQAADLQKRKKAEKTKRQLQVDLHNLCDISRRSYLPLVARRKLPQEHYERWRKCFEVETENKPVIGKDGARK